MKSIKKIGLLWLLFTFSLASHAANFSEGKQYTKLSTPVITQTGEKIEILEFFWYGCPHCYSFEPTLKKWKKTLPDNVVFRRVPAPLNPRWMPHTKAYYALEIMGEGDKYHDVLFKAIHVEKKKLFSKDAIANFLASQGLDKKAYLANVNSFAVEMRAKQAEKLGIQYRINGVPALTVNGKYTISGSQAGSYSAITDISDYLITKENK